MTNRPVEITLTGSPKEMGAQHGSLLREQIGNLAEIRCELLGRLYGLAALETAKLVAESMCSVMAKRTPEALAETTATARSAEIPFWKLLVAGAFSDISDVVSRTFRIKPNPHLECTLLPLRTSKGVVILGTWDSHASAVDSLILCRRQPASGPETLALSTAGWPMQQGVTSAGVGFAIANLVATTVSSGVSYIAALPHVCSGKSLAAVCKRLARVPHASARYYLICSESTQRSLEIIPGRQPGVTVDDLQCHTNHFTDAVTEQYEGRTSTIRTSRERQVLGVAFSEQSPWHASAEQRIHDFAQSAMIQRGQGDDDRTGAIFLITPASGDLHFVVPAPAGEDDTPEVVHRNISICREGE
ncbi:C45 family autoproteolytic acyltransferase/hydolase [Micromonospora profundi]|uniref:C45 family autoproteolytic acyltransferase/hydolase n=1 Tax=Micromonospora profundi TaxID=1420889 RepID=UPI003A95D0EA